MFEYVSYAYAKLCWTILCVFRIEHLTVKSVGDPGTFLAGAAAGGIARASVLPFTGGGAIGVLRRMPQFGFLSMFYVSVASKLLPGMEKDPTSKMYTTFLVASAAGFNMRFVCNPINRVCNECLRTGKSTQEVISTLMGKTILQFWYVGPNLVANAIYFGTLLTVFEGLRRYSERNFFPIVKTQRKEEVVVGEDGEAHVVVSEPAPLRRVGEHADANFNKQNYMTTAAVNTVAGGTAALVASTVCYPWSAHSYMQTVIHDSALCRGFAYTLLKEVPMMTVFFGTFSLLQPFFSPKHGVRCGFGY